MRLIAIPLVGLAGCGGPETISPTSSAATSTGTATTSSGAGAAGSTGSMGGAGGEVGGVGGDSGAGGETTGGCLTYVCMPDDCGPVDIGCGMPSDCGACSQQGDPNNPAPMTCNSFVHHCECAPEGNSDIALDRCNKIGVAEPEVIDFCYAHNGCDTAFCGVPPVPKAPVDCIDSTARIDYGDGTGDHEIWCCAKQ